MDCTVIASSSLACYFSSLKNNRVTHHDYLLDYLRCLFDNQTSQGGKNDSSTAAVVSRRQLMSATATVSVHVKHKSKKSNIFFIPQI